MLLALSNMLQSTYLRVRRKYEKLIENRAWKIYGKRQPKFNREYLPCAQAIARNTAIKEAIRLSQSSAHTVLNSHTLFEEGFQQLKTSLQRNANKTRLSPGVNLLVDTHDAKDQTNSRHSKADAYVNEGLTLYAATHVHDPRDWLNMIERVKKYFQAPMAMKELQGVRSPTYRRDDHEVVRSVIVFLDRLASAIQRIEKSMAEGCHFHHDPEHSDHHAGQSSYSSHHDFRSHDGHNHPHGFGHLRDPSHGYHDYDNDAVHAFRDSSTGDNHFSKSSTGAAHLPV